MSSTVSRMKKLGALKPALKFGFRRPGPPTAGFIEILPFRKSWIAIGIVALMTAAFSIPLFTLRLDFSGSEDLFDLTSSLFQLFWGFGWSVGVLGLGAILLALLFAREVLIVDSEGIRLRIEIFNLGVEADNPLPFLSNLRYVSDDSLPGAGWRHRHLAVDYLDVPISLGSDLDPDQADSLIRKINTTLKHPVPAQLSDENKALLRSRHARQHPDTEQVHVTDPQQQVARHTGSRSTWLLIAANLVPLAGVILLGWNVGDIMLLFWLESAIIGFFNILKMFRIAGIRAIFFSIFFIGHFGAFMSVHLMFIFGLFIEEEGRSASLVEVASIFRTLWPAIVALFVSHGFSYVENFIGRREYARLTISQQMHKPYSRIMLMHITLILGGFMVLALNSPLLAMLLLIVMKVVLDAGAHVKEHRTF